MSVSLSLYSFHDSFLIFVYSLQHLSSHSTLANRSTKSTAYDATFGPTITSTKFATHHASITTTKFATFNPAILTTQCTTVDASFGST